MKKDNYRSLDQAAEILGGRNIPFNLELIHEDDDNDILELQAKLSEKCTCVVGVKDQTPTMSNSHSPNEKSRELDDELAFYGFFCPVPAGYEVSKGYKSHLSRLIKKKSNGFTYVSSAVERIFIIMMDMDYRKRFKESLENAINVIMDPEILNYMNRIDDYTKPIEA